MLRKALAFVLTLAATTANAQAPRFTSCPEPRPQICPQVYNPVCGATVDGGRRTFGNSCAACAEKDVRGHSPGVCQAIENKK
jgi:cytochrome c5